MALLLVLLKVLEVSHDFTTLVTALRVELELLLELREDRLKLHLSKGIILLVLGNWVNLLLPNLEDLLVVDLVFDVVYLGVSEHLCPFALRH